MLKMYGKIDISIFDLFVVQQSRKDNRSYVDLFGYKKSVFDSLSYLGMADSQAELDVGLK